MTDANAISMEDFIFGTLATDELRVQALITARRGLTHNYRAMPRDPEPGQAVRIEVSAGSNAPVEEVFVHFTKDGSTPTLDNAATIPLGHATTEWDTLLWGYVRLFAGEVPGQPEGSVV